MTFSEEQKQIFLIDIDPPRKVDPLVIRRRLIRASKGRFGKMVEEINEPREFWPDEPAVERQEGELEEAFAARQKEQDRRILKIVNERRKVEEETNPDAFFAREEAKGRLLIVLREAFELPAFDGESGIVEATVWRIWWDWKQWCKKKD